jgi:hypothetical protein
MVPQSGQEAVGDVDCMLKVISSATVTCEICRSGSKSSGKVFIRVYSERKNGKSV